MKKVLSLGLVFVLVMPLFMTSFASNDLGWIQDEVDRTNAKIEQMIDKAREDVDRAIQLHEKQVDLIKLMGRLGNTNVDRLIALAEKALDTQIDLRLNRLVRETDREANAMIQKAARYGVTVECEYVEVTIGGKTVLIDPLRIIEW